MKRNTTTFIPKSILGTKYETKPKAQKEQSYSKLDQLIADDIESIMTVPKDYKEVKIYLIPKQSQK